MLGIPALFFPVRTLRARFVLPISQPPIEDGAVQIHQGRIVAVGEWKDLRCDDAEDLGERVLMPGLINAHCHLDYSGMRNAILQPSSFSNWVRRLNELKRTVSDDDYLDAIAFGFSELKKWGTTSVYNIESFPELMVRMPAPPLRTWWFYELLDIRSRVHTDDVVAGALAFFESRPQWLGGFGLSPHAPYTTSLGLYELSRVCCEKYAMPLMTHLAETIEEYEMFASASGVLYDFLAPLGRDMSDTGKVTPIRHLFDSGALPVGAILTHMNFVSEDDWGLLAQRHADFSVVHCPMCHEYFGREFFPLERFREIGMNLCLGTDSLASNKALNLFEEMRMLMQKHPSVRPEDALAMVTVNPALAIGLAGQLGELKEGAFADLIALPFDGKGKSLVEAVVANRTQVEWTMVNGGVQPPA
ncbi:cytosine/adenosine deaminase [Terrimicrobium sacchariphilum]|uniref:Cytosine/adenosine deaminase n=1 Tax=Terrimicrobium sacchariphilum TaxID=690879 RepID=A0A146G837_TERSA|nr:cytosine/adenosine deaminase [Terrimicrobium sacchariphilum]